MFILRLFGYLLLLAASALAQTQQSTDTTPKPCTAPEASQFDFWLGDWDLNWADSGKGTNQVTKPLGDCVVQEHFTDSEAGSLEGMSWSVFSPRLNQWQQTWVDNSGAYMVFTGGFADGKMTLGRETTRPDGKKIKQRMVFHDISSDSFVWDWQASEDNGSTWKTNWQIKYTRHKP